jgi:hypothetical protein
MWVIRLHYNAKKSERHDENLAMITDPKSGGGQM